MAEYQLHWTYDLKSAEWWRLGDSLVPTEVFLHGQGLKGAPDIRARFEVRDGIPEVVEFSIAAKSEGRAVRTADLSGWQPLEGLAMEGFRRFARVLTEFDPNTGEVLAASLPDDDRAKWKVIGDLSRAQDAGRARGPSQEELQQVANIYRGAIDGRPTEAVQVQLGYSRRTAARRVQQAREAGLLPKTKQGKKNA